MSEAGVSSVEINQCETGAVLPSQGDDGHSGFLNNAVEIAKSLNTLRFQDRDKDDLKLLTSILDGLMQTEEKETRIFMR